MNFNTRRKAVEPASFKNAEGVVPITYKLKNGFRFMPASTVKEYKASFINGLPVTFFQLLDPTSGRTRAFEAQCVNRDKVHAAYSALELGAEAFVTFIEGEVKPKMKDGIPVIRAGRMVIEIKDAPVAEAASPEVLGAVIAGSSVGASSTIQ